MSIILGGITLPDDMQWPDELSWSPVLQATHTSAAGALHIDEITRLAGRPITLVSAGAWLTRAQLDALRALAATPGSLLLSYYGTDYTVAWRHSEGAIAATEVQRLAHPAAEPGHYYDATLRLIEV